MTGEKRQHFGLEGIRRRKRPAQVFRQKGAEEAVGNGRGEGRSGLLDRDQLHGEISHDAVGIGDHPGEVQGGTWPAEKDGETSKGFVRIVFFDATDMAWPEDSVAGFSANGNFLLRADFPSGIDAVEHHD